ncbi:hypothetical protein GCM10023067_42650 [Aminobacter aganoensis]
MDYFELRVKVMTGTALYEVLGVGRNATPDEINNAYVEKVSNLPNCGISGLIVKVFGLKYHFDYAYSVLGNASKRSLYDAEPDKFDSATPNYLGF